MSKLLQLWSSHGVCGTMQGQLMVLWWPGQGVSTHGWPQEPPITLLHHCGGKAPRWEVINNLCLMERCLWVRIRASPASSKMPLAQHGCSDLGQVSLQKCHSPNPTQTQLSCISFFFFFPNQSYADSTLSTG